MGAVDEANAEIAKARAVIKARDVDIDKLLEQRQAHIPYPRRPPD
jgi:cob(I)alamin adenosyltransferase